MKKNYYIIIKTRYILLFILIIVLNSIKRYSLTINGPSVICAQQMGVYNLSGTTSNTTYTWVVYKGTTTTVSTANTFTNLPNNEAIFNG